MTKRKPDLPEGDDGRTIADMNVEGMPWYSPKKNVMQKESKAQEGREEILTRQESRYYTWGALKAALLVVGVMCIGLVLFVLFCLHIWFR